MQTTASRSDREYVLGTGDEEVARLGLQHRVWRSRALDAWLRAGFNAGQTLLDLGSGPGWATRDLAEIAGPNGRVIAVDGSRRFLDVIERIGLPNVETHELDLDGAELPGSVDGVWARWVFAFVRTPRAVLARAASALRPGGSIVIHEYFDYRTWRLAPRSEPGSGGLPRGETTPFESFVGAVMESWRANGGEPDIGLVIPGWLEELGLRVSVRPIIEVISPRSFIWAWPKTFVESGTRRLVQLGRMRDDEAASIVAELSAAEEHGALMVTPAVLEIIATKP